MENDKRTNRLHWTIFPDKGAFSISCPDGSVSNLIDINGECLMELIIQNKHNIVITEADWIYLKMSGDCSKVPPFKVWSRHP